MSLRKKFAENVFPIMLTTGALLGGSIGYQTIDHDWDDQRGSDADQVVAEFEGAFEELSALKQENTQLNKDRKSSLLKWDAVSDSGQKYQENLKELSQRSAEYAKLMLSSSEISERDFESLAANFNNIGLSLFSDLKVDPADADGLKECQLKHYSPNADSEMYSRISNCMDDDKKFKMTSLDGLIGVVISALIVTFPGGSPTLRRWRELPDKPKSPKSGKGMGARLARRINPPKRPQN